MTVFLFYLAIVTGVGYVLMAIEVMRGNRTIPFLKDIPPSLIPDPPKVSVIIAARNEERNMERAITSILQQDYQALEVVAVNDRSTDSTLAILKRLQSRFPGLGVLTIETLPAGWLGKNYALYQGARQATGHYLLFADADVVMEPSTLRRAMTYASAQGLDHLAVSPQCLLRGTLLNIQVAYFTFAFTIYARPWKVKDPKSGAHIGIGAFNLVRQEAYEKAGTHRVIALRPDDDLKLGKIIKQHGFHSEMAYGQGLLSIEWYRSVREMIQGLMKNTFAGVEYSLSLVILLSLAALVFQIWPFFALVFTQGGTRTLDILALGVLAWTVCDNGHFTGFKVRHCLAFPLAIPVGWYILWKASLKTLWEGGIEWRGTRYALRDLRANRV